MSNEQLLREALQTIKDLMHDRLFTAEWASKHGATVAKLEAALAQPAEGGEKPFPAPGAWFPTDVLGNPMREYQPGKWEGATWPSETKPAEGGEAVGPLGLPIHNLRTVANGIRAVEVVNRRFVAARLDEIADHLQSVERTTPPASQEQAAKARAWDSVRKSCVLRHVQVTLGDVIDTMDALLAQEMTASQEQAQPKVRLTADITDPAVQARLSAKFGQEQAQQHGGEEPSHEHQIGTLVAAIGKVAAALKFPCTPPLTGPEALRLALEIARHYERQPGGEVVAWSPLPTSGEGRAAVRAFFNEALKRRDFDHYINTALAADFACVLGGYLATLATPKPEPMTKEHICELWSWSATAEAERTATTQQHAFARAVEAHHGIKGQA